MHKEALMRQKLFRLLLLAIGCLLPWVSTYASDWWHSPGKADVLTTAGYAKTLIVQVVNLTPYEIGLNRAQLPYLYPNPTNLVDKYDSTALDPEKKKKFMFASLGVPQTIPGVPPEVYTDPDYINTTTRPYSFVLSWDDHGGNVDQSWISWIIHDVECKDPRCPVATEDLTLGLFVTREDPNKSLTAKDYWDLGKDVLSRAVKAVSVVVTPENPKAWKNFILSTGEIAMGVDEFNTKQTADDEGQKWYVAAYPFPEPFSYCETTPSDEACYPSARQATDAVVAEWAPGMGGWTQIEIVVTLQMRRGQKPVPEYHCNPYPKGLGAATIAAVTIMTLDQWNQANLMSMVDAIADDPFEPTIPPRRKSAPISSAAQLIHSTLEQSGWEGVQTLFSIIQDLNAQQRQVLRDMVTSWRAGESLTRDQQTFLHWLAVHLRNEMRHAEEG
jgi:hypothetical protein